MVRSSKKIHLFCGSSYDKIFLGVNVNYLTEVLHVTIEPDDRENAILTD